MAALDIWLPKAGSPSSSSASYPWSSAQRYEEPHRHYHHDGPVPHHSRERLCKHSAVTTGSGSRAHLQSPTSTSQEGSHHHVAPESSSLRMMEDWASEQAARSASGASGAAWAPLELDSSLQASAKHAPSGTANGLRGPSKSTHASGLSPRHTSRSSSSSKSSNRIATEQLPQWFAEMICYIWFSPSTSNLSGTSIPSTPLRSPTTAYAPAQGRHFSRNTGLHAKTKSQDFCFSTLSATPERQLGPTTNLVDHFRTHSDDQRLLPQPRFVAFIRDALGTTQVSTSVLILALLYIRRLKLMHSQILGQEGSEYRVGVAALMLGNKFLDDHTYTNKTWSDISGIALKDVTKLEIEFWLGLQMRIHVSARDYESWLRALEHLAGQRQQLLCKRARDLSIKRILAAEHSSPRTLRFYNPVPQVAAQNAGPQVPLEVSPFAFDVTQAPRTRSQAATASTPGSFDFTDANSSSPTSQRSHSTTATSVNGFWHDATHRWSPERAFNSRNVSPFDNGPSSHKHLPTRATASSWSMAHDVTPQGVGSESGRKRRRENSGGDSDGSRMAKRNGSDVTFGQSGSTEPAGAPPSVSQTYRSHQGSGDYRISRPSQVAMAPTSYHAPLPAAGLASQPTHASSSTSMDSTALHATPSGVNAENEHLYRSIFAQPLTPEGLMQAYSGPADACRSQQRERYLSFYQLAAGRGPGLPACHLPAPVQQGPWATYRNGQGRRSVLGTSSPRGETTHTDASGMAWSGYPMHPARLSPEAYGIGHGAYHNQLAKSFDPTSTTGLSVHPASCSTSPFGQCSGPVAGGSMAHPPQVPPLDDEKRWVPFCNVPIAMQMQHYQQWQQLDLPRNYNPFTADRGLNAASLTSNEAFRYGSNVPYSS